MINFLYIKNVNKFFFNFLMFLLNLIDWLMAKSYEVLFKQLQLKLFIDMQVLKRVFSLNMSTLIGSVRQTSSSQPSEYISTNLANGVGRYVCQLQRITFKFCKESPASSGIRYFMMMTLHFLSWKVFRTNFIWKRVYWTWFGRFRTK